MKTWDRFLKDVRPWAPGTPAPVAEHAVRRAAQVFCRETRAWLVELDPIVLIDGETVYDLPLPDRVELVRLESAKLGGSTIKVWVPEQERCTGRFVSVEGRRVSLSVAGAADAELVLRCAVMPSDTAIGVDDELFGQYSADIALGAVAGLLNDAAREAKFQDRCASVRLKLWRGQAKTNQRARANYF